MLWGACLLPVCLARLYCEPNKKVCAKLCSSIGVSVVVQVLFSCTPGSCLVAMPGVLMEKGQVEGDSCKKTLMEGQSAATAELDSGGDVLQNGRTAHHCSRSDSGTFSIYY